MLIHNPQSRAVYRNDKAGANLSERFEVHDLLVTWQRSRRIAIRACKIRGPVWRRRILSGCYIACHCGCCGDGRRLKRQAGACRVPKRILRFKYKTLIYRTRWRGGEVKTAVGAHAGAETRFREGRNDGPRNARIGRRWSYAVKGRIECRIERSSSLLHWRN